MTLSKDSEEDRTIDSAEGGLESITAAGRIPSLTGIRAVAALLVLGTHAAYTAGKYPQGFFGAMSSRLELGVPIFFVLSGYLLFGPWVKAAAAEKPSPSVSRYAWHRVRRIMPAYVVTVIAAYIIYEFRTAGPNPGHDWVGLIRNLTLTQIYTHNYIDSFLHQGLTQMWSLAVEVAFYVVLPVLAFLLLTVLCRRRWRPGLTLVGLGVLALITPLWLTLVYTPNHFLPDGARLWLPGYLLWFLGGMLLAVLQAMGVRWYAFVCLPLALICFLIVSTPIAGEPTTSPTLLPEALAKTVFYAAISTALVAPLALHNSGWYSRLLGTRPMVWLGEISYEIFLVHLIVMEIVMVDVLHWQVYTGSMAVVFFVTLAFTIPVAWVLHRFTRVRSEAN